MMGAQMVRNQAFAMAESCDFCEKYELLSVTIVNEKNIVKEENY